MNPSYNITSNMLQLLTTISKQIGEVKALHQPNSLIIVLLLW